MSRLLEKIKHAFREEHFRELSRGGLVSFVLMISGTASTYVFTLLVTRMLGADAMGAFSLSYALLYITSLVGKLGLDLATMRLVAERHSHGRWNEIRQTYTRSFMTVTGVSLILSAAMFIFASQIASYFFHKPHLTQYIRVTAAGVLPMALLTLSSQGLRGLKKIRESTFLANISAFLFAAVLLLAGLSLTRALSLPIYSFVLGAFISAVLGHFFWIKHTRKEDALPAVAVPMKSMISMAIPFMLSASIFYLMKWTDIIMLGMFRTEAEVGVYAVASRLALLMALPHHAINNIAAPKFAELWGRKDHDSLEKVVKQTSRLIFWSTAPVLLALILFPSFLLGIFGEEFRSGLHALLILTAGQLFFVVSGPAGHFLNMTGRQVVLQNIVFVALLMNIAFNYILIPLYGINGAAVASMLSLAIWNLSSVFYVKRFYNILTLYIPRFKTERKM